MISLIAAIGENYVLGNKGSLPWHIPEDFAWFKRKTLRKPVIMGRKTYDSIGKSLPNRLNIVISRYPQPDKENLLWVSSIDEAFRVATAQNGFDTSEIMILGGGEVYVQSIDMADRIYLTEIAASPQGDTFFPKFDKTQWHKKIIAEHIADDDQPAFIIAQYDRK